MAFLKGALGDENEKVRSVAAGEFAQAGRRAVPFLVETIEKGDLYVASRIAGLSIEEFNELRIKARIPNVA